MKKTLLLCISLISIATLTTSCAEFFEDCLFWPAKPNIKTASIPQGNVNTYYYTEIEAEIENDPDDLNYYYDFDVEGELPYGLEYWTYDNILIIEGTPQETGTFSFTVELYVEAPYRGNDDESDDNNICLGNDITHKTFTLRVPN
ncbi:hypothetical protein [Neptunitalea lumnitzerae]|uniref:Uncharacterized protein n=1 Tax=Neptunitalea lumnitzerae TaxID=2965509 RepID=A0ABQ5MEJ7_9FLAO|nr:hypothetical protein [Neptunitalea sp. Y10]GLB47788.1 hypothetical protein Y10_01560 [Neptunitalea sp. Y10]